MTFTAVQRSAETTAILAELNGAGLLADVGRRPTGGGFPGEDTTLPFVPYVVLWPSTVPQIDGPVSDPFADTISEYQVTAVGETAAQALWASDKARTILLTSTLTVTARFVQLVAWTGGQPATRDDDVVPPLFYGVDLYEISTSPA